MYIRVTAICDELVLSGFYVSEACYDCTLEIDCILDFYFDETL